MALIIIRKVLLHDNAQRKQTFKYHHFLIIVIKQECAIISEENKEKKPIKFCPECGAMHLYYDKKCKCGHEFEDVEECPQRKSVINPFYDYFYEDFYEELYHEYEDDFQHYEEWYRESEGMNCRDDDSWDYGNV